MNTQYKFITVVLADSYAAYIEANDLLLQEHALRKGARGCVDCLAGSVLAVINYTCLSN